MLIRIIALSITMICTSVVSGAIGETRIALVIGNTDYSNYRKLPNAANDADAMEQALGGVGFKVKKIVDGDKRRMDKVISDFSRELNNPNTVGLFYFAGHGFQIGGMNYLVPIDAEMKSKEDALKQTINLTDLLDKIEISSHLDGRVNLILLDACRDNLIRDLTSDQTGLAPMDAPTGTLISFSTSPGEGAADGQSKNSPYVEGLQKVIASPGVKIEDTFKATRRYVINATKNLGKPQRPWESTSLIGDFYFVPLARKSERNHIELQKTVDGREIRTPTDGLRLELPEVWPPAPRSKKD
jgi:uncharacterized caspase-like protein